MAIKKIKGVPEKIYVYDAAQHKVDLFKYYGTDMEDPIYPYYPNNYHIFVKDMGKPTVEKFEIDSLEFDFQLNEENFFTSKKGCEKFKKEKIKENISRIEKEILELENEKVQLKAEL
jgi:hypothetical protein